MKNFQQYYSETTENLFNVESSSLPSIFTDPGPATAHENLFDGDEVSSIIAETSENAKTENILSPSSGVNNNNVNKKIKIAYSVIETVQYKRKNIRNFGFKSQMGENRSRISSAKRLEKKKRSRAHSLVDLQKMRPYIASPFMPTLATQVSVNSSVLNSAQDRSKKTTLNNNNNNNISTINNEKNIPITSDCHVNVPGINFPPSTNTVKMLAHSKYGSVALKKATIGVKKKLTAVVLPAVDIDAKNESINGSNNESSSEDDKSDTLSHSSDSSVYTRFSDLTKKQWATVGMLAIANLCSTIAFSCIAPFYPAEAKEKKMSKFETGIVFGVFELIMFFSAPILGKYMAFFGSKRMFTVGLLITGVTAIAFGFLNFLPENRTFFWASFFIRCTEALGDACFVTSSFAISAKCFPGRIATVVGIMETFAGLGYTAGPVIGSVLYEYGGFKTPFLVLGSCLMVATVLSYYLIEEIEDEPTDDAMGMMTMLKIPIIWLMMFAVVICAISLSFFDPTLADHLSSFNLSTIMIGLMFLLCGGIYTLTAPLWGLLLDNWHCCNILMLFGSFTTVISMLLVGPSPIFNMEKNLVVIGIALAILGISAGALYIPTFQNCLDAVKNHGYDDSFQTYGCVSGVFQSAFAFGAFLGPTLGSFGVQQLGFGWTTTIIAIINLCFIFTLIVFFIAKSYFKKHNLLTMKEDIHKKRSNI